MEKGPMKGNADAAPSVGEAVGGDRRGRPGQQESDVSADRLHRRHGDPAAAGTRGPASRGATAAWSPPPQSQVPAKAHRHATRKGTPWATGGSRSRTRSRDCESQCKHTRTAQFTNLTNPLSMQLSVSWLQKSGTIGQDRLRNIPARFANLYNKVRWRGKKHY